MIQDFLKQNGIIALRDKLKIQVARHPTEPLCVLNYHQLDTPKADPLGRKCRGLVLEEGTWSLVARAFDRFFNLGEMAHELERFDWNDFTATTKEDGSLVLLYYYNGEWRANTRGGFGFDKVTNTLGATVTWHELIWPLVNKEKLTPGLTYVCELTTPFNKVVRNYPKPMLHLLTVFVGDYETTEDETDLEAKIVDLPRPQRHCFKNRDHLENFIRQLESTDPSCEGVVIRDKNNNRWKKKTKTYWSLHHMYDNGEFRPEGILPWIMNDRGDELFAYFPELKERYGVMRDKVLAEWDKLRAAWEGSQEITNQKEFAAYVCPRTPFNGILFQMRKSGEHTLADLERRWNDSDRAIMKVVKF